MCGAACGGAGAGGAGAAAGAGASPPRGEGEDEGGEPWRSAGGARGRPRGAQPAWLGGGGGGGGARRQRGGAGGAAAAMGNAGSVDAQQPELRAHSAPLKLPMPEPGELEERFAVVLVSPIVCPRPAGGGEGEKGKGKEGKGRGEAGRLGGERGGGCRSPPRGCGEPH